VAVGLWNSPRLHRDDRPYVIWVEIFGAVPVRVYGAVRVNIIQYGYGSGGLAEMVDQHCAHISKGGGRPTTSSQKVRAATAAFKATGNSRSGIPGKSRESRALKFPAGIPGNF